MNPSKSSLIHFTSRSTHRRFPVIVRLNGTLLPRQLHAKFLGITFSSNFSFSTHLTDVLTRARRRLACLTKIIGSNDIVRCGVIVKLYCSYIRPLLTYGYPAFSTITDGQFRCLEAFERRCLRFALNVPPWASNDYVARFHLVEPLPNFVCNLSYRYFSDPRRSSVTRSLLCDGDFVPRRQRFHNPLRQSLQRHADTDLTRERLELLERCLLDA